MHFVWLMAWLTAGKDNTVPVACDLIELQWHQETTQVGDSVFKTGNPIGVIAKFEDGLSFWEPPSAESQGGEFDIVWADLALSCSDLSFEELWNRVYYFAGEIAKKDDDDKVIEAQELHFSAGNNAGLTLYTTM